MQLLKVEATWIEYNHARDAFARLAQQFSTVTPTSSDQEPLETCLAGLAPFDGKRVVRVLSVHCESAIRDVRAADIDGDGRIEILAALDQGRVVCLNRATENDAWQFTVSPCPDLGREIVGLSLHEDELGQTHASLLARDHARTFIHAIHLAHDPLEISIRADPRVTLGSILIAPRREGFPAARSIDVMRAPQNDGGLGYEVRARMRARGATQEAVYRSPYKVLALTYDEHGIILSDTSPVLRCFLYPEFERGCHIENAHWTTRLEAEVTSLRLTHDEELVAATIDRGVYSLDSETGKVKWNEPSLQSVTALDVCDLLGDGRTFLIAGRVDGWLSVYELLPVEKIAQSLDSLFEWHRRALQHNATTQLRNGMRSSPSVASTAFRRALRSGSPKALELVKNQDLGLEALGAAWRDESISREKLCGLMVSLSARSSLAVRERLAWFASQDSQCSALASLLDDNATTPSPHDLGELLAARARLRFVCVNASGLTGFDGVSDERVPSIIYATRRGQVNWLEPASNRTHRLREPASARKFVSVLETHNTWLCVTADADGRLEIWELGDEDGSGTILCAESLGREIRGLETWSENDHLFLAVYGGDWGKSMQVVYQPGRLELRVRAEMKTTVSLAQAVMLRGTAPAAAQWIVRDASANRLVLLDATSGEERAVIPFRSTALAFTLLENDFVVACADGFLYRVNRQGELQWSLPLNDNVSAMDARDVNGDQRAELIVGLESGALAIISADGEILWTRTGETRPIFVRGATWDSERRHGLVIARNDDTIEWIELILPGSAAWQELVARAVTQTTAQECFASQDEFLHVLAFALSETQVDGIRDHAPEPSAPAAAQIAFAESIARAQAQDSLWRLLRSSLNVEAKCIALRALPTTFEPAESELEVLARLAEEADPRIRRAIVRQATRRVQPWTIKLLSAASRIEGTHADWVRGEIALGVRELFQASPSNGWNLAHDLLEGGVDPCVLQIFGASAPPVMRDEPARNLLARLGVWCGLNQPRDPAVILATLNDLASAIQIAQKAQLIASDDPRARVYSVLGALAQAENFEQLRTLVTVAVDLTETINWLDRERGHILFAELGELLDALRLTLTSGLKDWQNRQGNAVETLREFTNRLEAWRAQLARRAAPTIWSDILAALVTRWLTEDGALGKKLYALEHEFNWELTLVGYPNLVEDELQLTLRIRNASHVLAFNLLPQLVTLRAGEQVLPAAFEPPVPKTLPQLNAGEIFSIQVNAKLPKTILAQKPELEVTLALAYFVPPKPGASSKNVVARLGASSAFEIKYREDFPSAWARYEPEARRLARGEKHLILVELERSARRSFFEEWAKLAPELQPVLIDLREVYRGEARKLLQVRAKDLHRAMAQVIWQNNPKILDAIDQGYREAFRQALRATATTRAMLFLDHFDYLADELLESPEGREALIETLEFWLTLAKEDGLRLVLGGSYLARKIITVLIRPSSPELGWMRADEIAATPQEQQELEQFLHRNGITRRVLGAIDFFAKPLTVEKYVRLCAGNLHFLRAFGVDALTQAEQDAQFPAGKDRLGGMEPLSYLLEFANKRNFFTSAWVWLTFYEKLALLLVAQGEFALERADWVEHATGLKLSRDYYPGAPGGHRSRKLVAESDALIDEELAQKIHSDKYFPPDGVWVQGISLSRPASSEQDAVTRMLGRILDAVGRETILRRLTEEGILRSERRGSVLGEVFEFRIPLMRLWFRKNGAFERLKQVAQGSGAEWAVRSLWMDQGENHRDELLYRDRAFESRLAGQIFLSDLPKLDRALRDEEYPFFFNLYGIGKRAFEPTKRWRALVDMTRALMTYRDDNASPLQTTTNQIFEGMKNLLNVLPGETAGFHSLGEIGLIWQYSKFEEVFRGFQKEMLIGVIRDGSQLTPAAVEQLRNDAYQLLLSHAPPDPNGSRKDSRLVLILLVLRYWDKLVERWRRTPSLIDLHVVQIDPAMWAEICVAPEPRKQLLAVARAQVKWWVFSPYQSQGSINPGSGLFVGRQEEINRILGGIEKQNFVILGSRKMGKTSLLRQLGDRLEKNSRVVVIPINQVSTQHEFFDRVRHYLSPSAQAAFTQETDPAMGIRAAFQVIVRDEKKLPVILLDEVDQLYAEWREPFFLFLRDLTQSAPRLCSIIMTGYQRIFFALQNPNSPAFYNFCEAINIAEVEPESAKQLVDILVDELEITFYNRTDATELLLERTYCVPFLLQNACHELMVRLDKLKRVEPRLEKEDLEAVLTESIDSLLYKELLTNLGKDTNEHQMVNEQKQQRLQIMLLCAAIQKYPFLLDTSGDYRRLKHEERGFTASQAVAFLESWAHALKPFWNWTTDMIDTYLRDLTLTLALGTESEQGRVLYYFPLEMFPTVLARTYRENKRKNEKPDNALDDLEERMKSYASFESTRRPR